MPVWPEVRKPRQKRHIEQRNDDEQDEQQPERAAETR
jgi:hypothetical protein